MLIKQKKLCINRALENLFCCLVLKGLIYALGLKERVQNSPFTYKTPAVTFIVITILSYLDR